VSRFSGILLTVQLEGGCYVAAGRLNETLRRRFSEYGLPLHISTNVIPENDSTTLFISAGMQPLKPRFQQPDGTSYGNIQYCVRTNDIDEVGDGTHLTFFQMVGSFGFGSCDYGRHVVMWTNIVRDLEVPISHVNVHPESGFERYWEDEFPVRHDPGCVWTDGNVGGFCSELFTPDGVELGNLVNPLGHSIDVGFGYERILRLMEGKSRVDETELFNPFLDPISRDHFRTLSIFKEQGIVPGNKERNYVCRRLIRRIIRLNPEGFECSFSDWIKSERVRMDQSIRDGRKYWRRNRDKNWTIPDSFYWDTFGILPEEMHLVKS
jgi:alanyl-tRNA synthetase